MKMRPVQEMDYGNDPFDAPRRGKRTDAIDDGIDITDLSDDHGGPPHCFGLFPSGYDQRRADAQTTGQAGEG